MAIKDVWIVGRGEWWWLHFLSLVLNPGMETDGTIQKCDQISFELLLRNFHYAFIWKKNLIKMSSMAFNSDVSIKGQTYLWRSQLLNFTLVLYLIQQPYNTTS